jgi:RimJ/RimL family protein N-acetyltransferase
MRVIETKRLRLRHLDYGDAPFILNLLNQESFLRHIGDKGVRTPADARRYLREGPIESYRRFGFGLYLTELQDGGAPIGICGLVKREALEDVDIGFALLPKYWNQGYAVESAGAVLGYGRQSLRLGRIVAVVAPGNPASIAVIEKIGLRYERMVRLADDSIDLMLYAG